MSTHGRSMDGGGELGVALCITADDGGYRGIPSSSAHRRSSIHGRHLHRRRHHRRSLVCGQALTIVYVCVLCLSKRQFSLCGLIGGHLTNDSTLAGQSRQGRTVQVSVLSIDTQ